MSSNTSTRSRWFAGRSIMLFACGMPFLLSIVFHGLGASAQPMVHATSRPALVFDQYLVNKGRVEPTAQVPARFGFTNRSSREVTILELRPSCGCLQPRLDKKTFAPNESGEFWLRVQTANESPGPKQYFCNVVYDDGETRETQVTFKVHLPDEQVTVRPTGLLFYAYNREGDANEQMLVVTDFRAKTLDVTSVQCASPLIEVRLGETNVDAQGNSQIRVAVTLNSHVPAGRHQALVRIRTDDPKYPQLEVPIIVHGINPADLSGRAVTFQPELLSFQSGTSASQVREIVVTSRNDQPVKITAVACDLPQLHARVLEADAADIEAKRVRIEVSLTADMPAGRYRSLVTIQTDKNPENALQVPVLIHGKR